ncbi:hypothetical protein SynMVIR181_01557 [Synechococcus sp. MVIR-18-1]|nr:hypothetical protein SynMVIR181_01557 [Synechococcus sp. MVIR-18-1]
MKLFLYHSFHHHERTLPIDKLMYEDSREILVVLSILVL